MNFHCPICRSNNIYIHLDDGATVLSPDSLGSSRTLIAHGRILRCRDCRFAFRQERYDPHTLADLYRQMDTSRYEAEAAGRARTAARHLQIVQRYIKQGSILDVGCASGLFLELAGKTGWEITGLEPSVTLFEKATATLNGRGKLYSETLEHATLPKASFDAVTLWDVLEHVPEPLDFLTTCRELLRPGGYLFVNVPDLESLQSRVLGSRWPLLLAEHLNYFDRSSLRLCGTKAGLTLLRFARRRAYFSVDYLLYRLAQHGIPGTSLGRRLTGRVFGRLCVPISLGETLAVWRKRS